MYMNYAADDLRARGQITASSVLIADATAPPTARSVDDDGRDDRHRRAVSVPISGNRRRTSTCGCVPPNVPVPHVDSILDLRLRRRPAASTTPSSPGARRSRSRSSWAPWSARARSARSTRCRGRCDTPAKATRRHQPAAIRRRARRRLAARSPLRRDAGRTLSRRRRRHDAATLVLTGGGRSPAPSSSKARCPMPTCRSRS